MKGIMTKLREDGLKSLAGKRVVKIRDIQQQIELTLQNLQRKLHFHGQRATFFSLFLKAEQS